MSTIHTCKICNQRFDSRNMGNHIRFTHKLASKNYYDTYLKTPSDGVCAVCGKPCLFMSITAGYAITCCRTCGQLNQSTREKIRSTNLEKYGVTSPAMNKDVQEKTKLTNRAKYGVDTPYQNNDIKAKGMATTLAKYGVDNVFQSEDIKIKSKTTMIEKYGVGLNILRPEIKQHIKLTRRKQKYPEFLARLAMKQITYLDTEDMYVTQECDRRYQCNYCNKLFTETSTQAYDVQCGCLRRRSKGEHEIYEWLISRGYSPTQTEYIYDDIGRMEIDVAVEHNGRKIGIEFCGIYWHSELFRPNDYHSRKLNTASKAGYRLLQIYEDEWRDSKDLVKSMILQTLGDASLEKIDARKCTIVKLTKTPTNFLKENHIQGSVGGSYSYGLEYNNMLVSVIVFGKNRFADGWECLRFCNKTNTNVRGGFSRLLKKFITDVNANHIVSYADLRYFTGAVYEANGFTKSKVVPVGYFYCPKGFQERLNRMRFQKHKLKHMKSYSNDKTEVQIMLEEGYTRIFDAGQASYEWRLTLVD